MRLLVCNVLTIKYWEMLPPALPPNILQAEIIGLLNLKIIQVSL